LPPVRKRQPDIPVIDPPEVVAEKIRLAAEMNKRPEGEPSGCDLLLEERIRERIRENKQEGF
jgi:hypothetical protein